MPEDRVNVAAVDLGSNSFHMVIARLRDEGMLVLDRLREPVRLAEGLDRKGRLSEEAQERALLCLERFGQRIRNLPAEHVRAVGTNTLRRAREARDFRTRAREALGHPIEVIGGQEEARLIYLGVAHSSPATRERRLVVDIGGGSTEIMLGRGFELDRAHSLFMGCVTYSREHFAGGALTREGFRAAETIARQELEPFVEELRQEGWESSLGASGTINAIADILRENGWCSDGITPEGLKRLRRELIAGENVERLELAGLKRDRAPVLPGGLAILRAIFKSLKVERMVPSAGALREGVLYDLVGRIRHEDVRDRTISGLVDQYHVNLEQAARVEATALGLFDALHGPWGLPTDPSRRWLRWAARLHELGLSVSYTGYQRHGAYLLRHHDMPGFSRDDQLLLSTLVRGHRRKLDPAIFAELPHRLVELARPLCVLLRLAVLLHRNRVDHFLPSLRVSGDASGLRLGFPPGWLEEHPLTAADLAQERRALRAVDRELLVDV